MPDNLFIFLLLGTISGLAWGAISAIFAGIFLSARGMLASWLAGGVFGYALVGAAWATHTGIFAARFAP